MIAARTLAQIGEFHSLHVFTPLERFINAVLNVVVALEESVKRIKSMERGHCLGRLAVGHTTKYVETT